MATNFMATSRMTILRVFIHNEDLTDCNWQLHDGFEQSGSGSDSLQAIMKIPFDSVEVYLSPHLATIFKADLGAVSDRKISDDLLLGVIEDSLAEEMDDCKPILMRLTDGVSYIAVLTRNFYQLLLSCLSEHVKQVKFIQPFSYASHYQDTLWTVFLIGEHQYVRTSQFEYFLLDDAAPVPLLLESMLENYTEDSIILYCEDESIQEYLEKKYSIRCLVQREFNYGSLLWNFYNEKSKRFNLKLTSAAQVGMLKFAKTAGVLVGIYVIYWLLNLGVLIYQKNKLQQQVIQDISGIIKVDQFTPGLLATIDEKFDTMSHDKGVYSQNDYISLFATFLKTMPDVNKNVLVGSKYSGQHLDIFLNSQYDPSQFNNDKVILLNKRILATISDYKSYQSSEDSSSKNNNGGGVLNNLDATNSSAAQMPDPAWVISLQIISNMDELNDKQIKATK